MAPLIIYITGFRQHAGKTVTSLGLISTLRNHIPPEKIGYIKPVGQELVKLPNGEKIDKDAFIIKQFSKIPDIDIAYTSPVRLGSGFTKKYLSNKNTEEETRKLQNSIFESIETMKHKKVIIAEGTGHPGVGGIVGLSNAEVINMLNAETVFLSGGGIGKALDMLEVDLSYFMYKKSPVKGILFNKIYPTKLDQTKKYITEELLNQKYPYFKNMLRILGYLPSIDELYKPSMRSIMERFTDSIALGKIDGDNWIKPCRRTNIISLTAEYLDPQKYIKPGDIILIGSGSKKRIHNILKYNKTMPESIAGIILTCRDTVKMKGSLMKEIQNEKIPVIMVKEDTASTEQIVLDSFNNTKLQAYDYQKVQNIEELFEKHFDSERFFDTFSL